MFNFDDIAGTQSTRAVEYTNCISAVELDSTSRN